jgi:hypothetical protein
MQLKLFTDSRGNSFRIIEDKLGMSGRDVSFLKEPFFGLAPGDKVKQIGDGRENGTIRTDCFGTALVYRGSILCQFGKPEKMFAFEFPHSPDGDRLYLLYGSTGHEIFTEGVYARKDRTTKKVSGYMRFYAPVFIKES